jgi:putative chitinase
MLITQQQLTLVMPQARTQLLENFLDEFNLQLPGYQLNTPLRIAAYLAQGALESGELRELSEILYYTSSARLQQVWPSRFPTVQSTLPYLRNPVLLGNFVYANRMGNGNPASGDGYKYRGRGWFSGTGKDFYKKMSDLTQHDFISSPDDLILPKFAVQSACEFWASANLNALADAENFTQITKVINGGLTGLAARLVYYHKARLAFGIDK